MVFTVAELIAYLSSVCELRRGDIIFTGTPSGVGHARQPPVFMKNGDTCEIEIQGIGVVRNPVVDEKAG